VVWVLAAALVAGIAREYILLFLTPLLALRLLLAGDFSRGEAVSLGICVSAFFLYGYLGISNHQERVDRLASIARDRQQPVCVSGWVSTFPRHGFGLSTFEFTTRVNARELRLFVIAHEFDIGYGDSLRLCGRIASRRSGPPGKSDGRPIGYARGMAGTMRVRAGEVVRLGGSGGNAAVRRFFWQAHELIRRKIALHLGVRAAIPLALVLGERGFLARRTRDTFKRLGLSHLLALSGLHLGIIATVLLAASRRIRAKNYILVVALALYVGVVGTIFSLHRAFIMIVVLVSARLLRRPLNAIHALGSALVLMLLFHPYALFDVGFQLSFLATFAVLAAVRRLRFTASGRLPVRIWKHCWSSILISSSAQLMTAPLVLHYFGRLSVVSPVATLLFLPLVAVILVASGICAVLSVLGPRWGALGFTWLDQALRLFEVILSAAGDAAPDPLQSPAPDTYLYYGGITLCLWPKGGRKVKLLGSCCVLGAIALSLLNRQ
jgi:ComEC/Rec2-related protein